MSPKSDVYSLGCVLYEIYCRRIPFEEETDGKAVAQSVISGVRPLFPEVIEKATEPNDASNFREHFRSTIERAWSHNAQDRQEPAEIESQLSDIRDIYTKASKSSHLLRANTTRENTREAGITHVESHAF